MEIEEQAIEETGESRFSNVLGTRTYTYYLLPIHIINYQQLMMYRVLRYCTKPYFSFTTSRYNLYDLNFIMLFVSSIIGN